MEKSRRKRVLIVTNLPTPYKIDFYEELGKYCELTVVIEARRFRAQKFNWNDDKISTFRLVYLNNGYLNERRINIRLLKYLNCNYNTIIIAAYYMPTEMLGLLWLKMLRIPYLFESDGGMINRGKSEWNRKIKNFLIANAKAYLSPSVGTDEYLSYYKADPMKIYRYPFTSLKETDILSCLPTMDEKQNLRRRLGIVEPKVILAVGQFIHRKGFDVLLEAARKMTKDKDAGIYIVGGEPTEEYLRMQREYGLSQVHFVGFKTKAELTEYFKAADLFVLPTREDIWGLVINEAMAYGLPVVTTNKCVAGMELIEDKDCLVDIDNPEQLRLAMEKILGDANLCQRYAEHNLKKIRNYTIEKMAQAHLKIIQETE